MGAEFPSVLEMGDLAMPFDTAFEMFPAGGSQPYLAGFWTNS